MNTTESYYVLYDDSTKRYLTPLMDWNDQFGKAKRIHSLKEANYLYTRERNAFNDVKVLICQASIEMVEV